MNLHFEEKLTVGNKWEVSGKLAVAGTETHFGPFPSQLYTKKLMHQSTARTGLLPPVVRWMSPSRRYVILERPPQLMSIMYAGVRANAVKSATRRQEFLLPIPWTVYAIGLDTEYYPYLVYMFGTHGPLTTYGDLLYLLPLPNIDNAGKFCVPAPQIETVPLEERSVAWGINTAYQMIWDSNFNTDILDSVRSSYASQAPKSIFGNIGAADKNAYAVSPLFASWQELSLDEVVKVSDWMHPNGNYFNVLNAMELLIGTEAQDYTSHTFVNMMYRTAMEIDQEKKSQAAR